MKPHTSFRYFDIILATFAAALLISNLAATKLIAFGPIITDGGAILFPLVYIFGDVLTEVYGYKYARRAIWTGFGIMVLAVLAFTIVRYMPGAPEYTAQASYEAVLGFFPRIVLASLCAYLIGSFVNAYVLAKLKVATQGKRLWARLIGSTVAGEFLDTLVFGLVAFGGILGMKDMVIFILVGWVFKTAVEVVLLPVTYRVVAYLKRIEHSDATDADTDFTPFKVS
jgi:queuosine precursor transporter